jgi:PAS domain S-box-containing protein
MFEKLLKDPQFLPEVFETMRDGLLVVDTECRILFINRAAEEITGFTKEEVTGQPCSILDTDTCAIHSASGEKIHCNIFQQGTICNKRCQIKSKDGRSVYLLKNAAVLKDSNGEIIGAVESITDITSLYLKELELQGLRQELRQEYWFMGLLGRSVPMQRLFEQIRNAAVSEAPVLILEKAAQARTLLRMHCIS